MLVAMVGCSTGWQAWLEVRGDVEAGGKACDYGVELPYAVDDYLYFNCQAPDRSLSLSAEFEQVPDWSGEVAVGAFWPGESGGFVGSIRLDDDQDDLDYEGWVGTSDDHPEDAVGLDVVCSIELSEFPYKETTRTDGVFQCDQLEADAERAADAVKTAGFTLTWSYGR